MPHSIALAESSTDLTYDLTTVAAVNAALGVEGNTADDAETAAEITAVSVLLGERCDRVFALQTVVETFMLHEHWIHGLPLHHYPVTEVASVVVNNSTLAASDYKVDPPSGLLLRWGGNGCFGWPPGQIVVTYTGGYDLPEGAPASLARACIEMIEDARAGSADGRGGDTTIRDIQHGDKRMSFFQSSVSAADASLSASVADLIRPYRRVNV